MRTAAILTKKMPDEEIVLYTIDGMYVGKAFIPGDILMKNGRRLPKYVTYGSRVFLIEMRAKYREIDAISVEDTFMANDDGDVDDGENIFQRLN